MAWMPDLSKCACRLTYTDLRNLTTAASLAHQKPAQTYDPHGHYTCSGCNKDVQFDGPFYHPRLMIGTIKEQHGWAFHCAHGVDVCMACASFEAKTRIPGRTIAGVPNKSVTFDRISSAKRKRK